MNLITETTSQYQTWALLNELILLSTASRCGRVSVERTVIEDRFSAEAAAFSDDVIMELDGAITRSARPAMRNQSASESSS